MNPLRQIITRRTLQNVAADPLQSANAAGGFTFTVTPDALVNRFLTLGTTGGTYYTSERELTRQTAGQILDIARDDAAHLVEQIVEVSLAGRAPKPQPALFALAAASALGDEQGRRAAFDALPQVARTGTHLFTWAGYREQFGGWGRGARRAVANWYTTKSADALAYQVVKYRQREGWSHRDLLRLTHPSGVGTETAALFQWITQGEVTDGLPSLVAVWAQAQVTTNPSEWAELVAGSSLSWEMLPSAALTEPVVWEAILAKGMPLTALIRQLPRLTRLGVTDTAKATITAKLTDQVALKKARIHPINVLIALRTYAEGASFRGESTWTPDPDIIDALDASFYAAFGSVNPAGKRTMIGVDVSGSMGFSIGGLGLSAREVAAALALVTKATEPFGQIMAFSKGFVPLAISPRQRLDDALKVTSGLPFDATDCAVPMQWALKNKLDIDTFMVITDNETWYGDEHPHQALRRYRETTGIAARLAVVATTGTNRTIAVPDDPGMLDVCGFDAAVPNLVADFSRGEV